MKQISTPITAFWQGVSLIAGFGISSALTAYLAYQEENNMVAVASLILLGGTGLAINSTVVYLQGDNSLSEDMI